jgi:hypothetical protein
MRASIQPRLAPALGIGARSRALAGGATLIALSVTADLDGPSVDRLLLSPNESRRARALAGSIVTRLGPNTSMALGISQSGLALASQLNRRNGDSFLVGSSAIDGFGFDTRAKSGLAVRQRFAGIALTASAEAGAARLWALRDDTGPRSGYRLHGYSALSLGASKMFGAFGLSARATSLMEEETVLGARFDPLFGTGGASSWFADLEARWKPAEKWDFAFAWRQGWTRIGAGGIRQNADHLQTRAWSFDATRSAVFDRKDRMSIRVAQPLRVARGGFDLTVPTSYDYETGQAAFTATRLNLAPTGRERDLEAVYSRTMLGGQVSLNSFWRHQPGNFANAPEDLGAAIRFTFGL